MYDDDPKEAPFNDEDIKCALGTMYGGTCLTLSFLAFTLFTHSLCSRGGHGTNASVYEVIKTNGFSQTVSTLQSFMLAMVLNPSIQAKAHAELDRVCPGRLPDFGDYDALPYVKAIMLEALRWNPVAPEGK